MIVHNVYKYRNQISYFTHYSNICAMFEYLGYCGVNINDTVCKDVRISVCVTCNILEGQNILYVFRCSIILIVMFLIKRADKKVRTMAFSAFHLKALLKGLSLSAT